jgi:hypothetical protein
MHTCCWVIRPATSSGGHAQYCGAPTKYHIVLDDDGNKVHKYDSLCEEHRVQVVVDDNDDDESST